MKSVEHCAPFTSPQLRTTSYTTATATAAAITTATACTSLPHVCIKLRACVRPPSCCFSC
eukprot:3063-Heterococcus_DN1.PRE.1